MDLPGGWYDVVGRGRMGQGLAAALSESGLAVRGPLGRGVDGEGATIVILCVPDREIAAASAALCAGAVAGHVSASCDLSVLEPHERFALHPLMSVVGAGARFAGATCAVEGNTDRATGVARALATRLGMHAQVIRSDQRRLYHAAASAASNYLVTLESMAERLASGVGLDRAALVPLVRATVEHWAMFGAEGALTGPIARGDDDTVRGQREAVADAAPDMLPLWDALVDATKRLAGNMGTLPR